MTTELSPEQLDKIAISDLDVSTIFSRGRSAYKNWTPYPRLSEIDTKSARLVDGEIPTNGSGGLNEKQYAVFLAATQLNDSKTQLLHPTEDHIARALGRSKRGYRNIIWTLVDRLESIRRVGPYPFVASVIEGLRKEPVFEQMYLQELAVVIARGRLTSEIIQRYSPPEPQTSSIPAAIPVTTALERPQSNPKPDDVRRNGHTTETTPISVMLARMPKELRQLLTFRFPPGVRFSTEALTAVSNAQQENLERWNYSYNKDRPFQVLYPRLATKEGVIDVDLDAPPPVPPKIKYSDQEKASMRGKRGRPKKNQQSA